MRGPRHVVTSGQTPVLDPSEACARLDSVDTSTRAGPRDRALIGLMVYSFARIGAALGMAVEDFFTQKGAAAREGRQAPRDAVPSQPRGISHRLMWTAPAYATIPRGRRSARSGAAPASSPARCCRRRTPMR